MLRMLGCLLAIVISFLCGYYMPEYSADASDNKTDVIDTSITRYYIGDGFYRVIENKGLYTVDKRDLFQEIDDLKIRLEKLEAVH